MTPRNITQLYPIITDTFRVVVVLPKRQIGSHRIISWYDLVFVLFGLTVYISCCHIGRNLILGDETAPSVYGLIQEAIFGMAALTTPKMPRFMFVFLAKMFYYFIFFGYSVATIGRLIAIMTNSVVPERVLYLNAVKYCDDDILVSTTTQATYPYLVDQVKERLRDPVVLNQTQLEKRIKEDRGRLYIVLNDYNMRRFLARHLQNRKYCLVRETFGKITLLLFLNFIDFPVNSRAPPSDL